MHFSLLDLQFFQELHDREYHRDIYSLTTIARVTHLHQHLIKYDGGLSSRVKCLPDTLACILSIANSLKINLTKEFERSEKPVLNVDDIKPLYIKGMIDSQYYLNLKRMAKLLEGYDHAESLKFRDEFGDILILLLTLVFQRATDSGDTSANILVIEYLDRLEEIKQGNMFHPQFHQFLLNNFPQYKSMLTLHQTYKLGVV